MKTRTIILLLFFVLGVLSTACSRHTCPVYADEKTEVNKDVG